VLTPPSAPSTSLEVPGTDNIAVVPEPDRTAVTGRDLLFPLLGLILGLVLLVLGFFGAFLAFPELEFDERSPWVWILIIPVTHGLPMLLAWLRMRRRWTTLGHWALSGFRWSHVVIGIAVGAALMAVMYVSRKSGVIPIQAPLMDSRKSVTVTALSGIFVGLAGPIVEEIVFRGMLFRWLLRRVHVGIAVVMSALIFGVIHFNGSFVPVYGATLCGLAFAIQFHLQRTLWGPIIAHITINSAYMGFLIARAL
jgi:membrane protease YdiL (CAAX protease family)